MDFAPHLISQAPIATQALIPDPRETLAQPVIYDALSELGVNDTTLRITRDAAAQLLGDTFVPLPMHKRLRLESCLYQGVSAIPALDLHLAHLAVRHSARYYAGVESKAQNTDSIVSAVHHVKRTHGLDDHTELKKKLFSLTQTVTDDLETVEAKNRKPGFFSTIKEKFVKPKDAHLQDSLIKFFAQFPQAFANSHSLVSHFVESLTHEPKQSMPSALQLALSLARRSRKLGGLFDAPVAGLLRLCAKELRASYEISTSLNEFVLRACQQASAGQRVTIDAISIPGKPDGIIETYIKLTETLTTDPRYLIPIQDVTSESLRGTKHSSANWNDLEVVIDISQFVSKKDHADASKALAKIEKSIRPLLDHIKKSKKKYASKIGLRFKASHAKHRPLLYQAVQSILIQNPAHRHLDHISVAIHAEDRFAIDAIEELVYLSEQRQNNTPSPSLIVHLEYGTLTSEAKKVAAGDFFTDDDLATTNFRMCVEQAILRQDKIRINIDTSDPDALAYARKRYKEEGLLLAVTKSPSDSSAHAENLSNDPDTLIWQSRQIEISPFAFLSHAGNLKHTLFGESRRRQRSLDKPSKAIAKKHETELWERFSPPAQQAPESNPTDQKDFWLRYAAEMTKLYYLSAVLQETTQPTVQAIISNTQVTSKYQSMVHSKRNKNLVLGIVTGLDDSSIASALDKIHRQDGRWSTLTTLNKQQILSSFIHEIQKHHDELLTVMSEETGKDVEVIAREIAMTLRAADKFSARVEQDYRVNMNIGKPITGIQSNGDTSLNLIFTQMMTALCNNQSVILIPGASNSITWLKLTQILLRAGMPPETLHYMPCQGNPVDAFLKRNTPLVPTRIDLPFYTGRT